MADFYNVKQTDMTFEEVASTSLLKEWCLDHKHTPKVNPTFHLIQITIILTYKKQVFSVVIMMVVGYAVTQRSRMLYHIWILNVGLDDNFLMEEE